MTDANLVAGAACRRRLSFGALELVLSSADSRLHDAIYSPFVGFHAGGRPALSVAIDFSLDGGLQEVDVVASFREQERGVLVDRSEGWEAALTGFVAGATPRARARLRNRRPDPRVYRKLTSSFARAVAATAAPLINGLLFHGCAMTGPAGQGAALFVGASGQGKTTMVRRLPRWRALADDCVLVRLTPAGPTVSGTPFAGKEGLPRCGEEVPLTALYCLSPGARTLSLTPLEAPAAFAQLAKRLIFFASGTTLAASAWELLGQLAEAVPTCRLASNLEHDLSRRLAC